MTDVIKALPRADIFYLADHGAYPYGDKDEDWLLKRVNALIQSQLALHQPDLIIIACNTASTLALPSLRAQTDIPIIGVVPAIKTAAEQSPNRQIGLLATPGTVARTYIDDLIREFANDCAVTRVGTTELVHMAEDKLAGRPIAAGQLATIIEPFQHAQCDTVVLGCTHFPLLKAELMQLDANIQWIDSGEAIARRADSLMGKSNTPQSTKAPFYTFASTLELTSGLIEQLQSYGFKQHQHLPFPVSASC